MGGGRFRWAEGGRDRSFRFLDYFSLVLAVKEGNLR